MGLSLREVVAVFDLFVLSAHTERLGLAPCIRRDAERHADGGTVAEEEIRIEVDSEEKWLYVSIDTDSKLLLEVDVFSRRGTDPAAAFLHSTRRGT